MSKDVRRVLALLKNKEQLFSAGEIISYQKGEVIFGERDKVGLCFVVEGHVALYKESRFGEAKIIFICGKDECLNELAIDSQLSSVAAKALDQVSILMVPVEAVLELMDKDSSLLMAIHASLVKKTRRLYHQAGNANGTYPLENRLMAKIWKLSRDYGRDVEMGRQIDFEITVTMLASMLGAKRETVSRCISKLKAEGIIIMEKGIILVPDMDALRKKV